MGAKRAGRKLAPPVFDSASYHHDIARLAYHYWEQRGRANGSPEEDWFRAEQELRQSVLAASL